MTRRPLPKRSEHELKRLIEEAVSTRCRLADRGLWFCIDRVEANGRPPERLKAWATLHFLPAGSPFCCGEPECHLGLIERIDDVNDHVRRAMNLRQPVIVDFGDRIAVNYHAEVRFSYEADPE